MYCKLQCLLTRVFVDCTSYRYSVSEIISIYYSQRRKPLFGYVFCQPWNKKGWQNVIITSPLAVNSLSVLPNTRELCIIIIIM